MTTSWCNYECLESAKFATPPDGEREGGGGGG